MRIRTRTSLQERLEANDLGRVLISACLIVVLLCVVAINMSNSRLRLEANKRGQPLLNAIGLDQGWGVFAPDPRRQSLDFFANVKFADGSIARWRLPKGGAALGVYWDNRWMKYLEYIVVEQFRGTLYRPAAIYIAKQEATAGRRPVQVTFHRRTQVLLPPGAGPDALPWKSGAYYRLRITPQMLGKAA
jgi:hypothetical protein